jgi:regulatory protein
VDMKVTAIERAAGGSPRLAVFIDGRKAFTVSEDVADRMGLEVGAVLGDGDVRELAAASDRERARESALRLLAVRARSRNELLDRLSRKGFAPEVAEDVVGGLEDVGLIDDRAFAKLWADERLRLRPVGPRRLTHELLVKGVGRAVVDEVVAETFAANPELEVARRAVAKRVKGLAGQLDPKELGRIRSFLLRRGFSHEVTREVLDGLSRGQDG